MPTPKTHLHSDDVPADLLLWHAADHARPTHLKLRDSGYRVHAEIMDAMRIFDDEEQDWAQNRKAATFLSMRGL